MNLNKIIIEETNRYLLKEVTSLILENSLDRKINNLIKKYYNVETFDEIREIRSKLLNKIPNARIENGKYMYSVFYFCIEGKGGYDYFNSLLGLIYKHPESFSNYPFMLKKDFGGASLKDVKDAFYNVRQAYKEENIGYQNFVDKKRVINGYTIYRIETQEEAHEIANETSLYDWCIMSDMYDEMINEDDTCYLVLNNSTYKNAVRELPSELYSKLRNIGKDYLLDNLIGNYMEEDEDEEEAKKEALEYLDDENDLSYELTDCGCYDFFRFSRANKDLGLIPYDEYGLSAFVVIVNKKDNYFQVYSRYNLDEGMDGNSLNSDELESLIGVPFKEAFPSTQNNRDW